MITALQAPGNWAKCAEGAYALTATSAIQLSAEQIALFHEQGFLTLPEISPASEVSSLKTLFERLFAERAGRKEGAQFDMVTHDDDDAAPKLSQIIKPANFAPELLSTEYRQNGLRIARQLLGEDAVQVSEHAILKPAGYGAATPWHQDEAFREAEFDYQQVSIWMPLQEATVENGCMQYVPGTHRLEVLDHRSPGDDPRVHALECTGGFDADGAVVCPLPPGGAAVHHGRTLHFAGPNGSNISRYAYVLMFEAPPKPAAQPRDFYWNRGKQTASLVRRRRWRMRGGALVVLWRKLRGELWRSPGRAVFYIRRALGRRR
jgi:hypothetical protein